MDRRGLDAPGRLRDLTAGRLRLPEKKSRDQEELIRDAVALKAKTIATV
jgi:hypothetical protein